MVLLLLTGTPEAVLCVCALVLCVVWVLFVVLLGLEMLKQCLPS